MDKKIRRPAVPEFPSLVCQVFFGYLQGDRKMCKNKVVNAGKTTLITRLLPVLTDYGLKVATVKHDGHEFEGDVPGTDTYRHMKAGAFGTAVFYKYAKHIVCTGININAVSSGIIFCKYCSHRILSLLIIQSIISYKNQKHFNQFTCHFYFVLYCFIDFSCPCICPYQSS